LSLFTVEALDQAEDPLICSAITDYGQIMDNEVAIKFFSQPGQVLQVVKGEISPRLEGITQQRVSSILRQITERNGEFFEAEVKKLDNWAEDLKVVLEREIKEFDRQIKEARRAAANALTLNEKLEGQKQVKELEKQRNLKRRSLFEAQDQVDLQRDELIAETEGKLSQNSNLKHLFSIRWSLL
jgi:hypothetical protein